MNKMRLTSFILPLSFCIAIPASAQTVEAPSPPALPTAEERAQAAAAYKDRADEQNVAADEVTLQRVEGGSLITEYRRRSGVYMVRIKPSQGPSQYWVDHDGDGQLQNGDTGLDREPNLPKWRLGNW